MFRYPRNVFVNKVADPFVPKVNKVVDVAVTEGGKWVFDNAVI